MSRNRIVVLLPPSEGKADGGRGAARTPGHFAELEPARLAVAAALIDPATDLDSQLGVGAEGIAAARAAHVRLAEAPALPALRRYTGVLYAELGYPGQPPALRRRLEREVVIVSGLWGLLRGDDRVPAYKLPIGISLPGLGRLATWWRPVLSPVLDAHVAGAVVWDLLPGAYAAAWRCGGTARARWTVRVLREQGGRRIVVSHDNKAVKGALARAVIEGRLTDPGQLAGWSGPGGYAVAGVDAGEIQLVTRS